MRPSSRSAAAIIALASTRALSVDAFATANVDKKYSSLASGTDPARAGRHHHHHHHHRRRGSIFGNSKNRSSSSLRSAIGEATPSPSPSPSAPPSWEELSNTLRDATTTSSSSSSSIEPTEPLVTLYRDTNGWCPFCERVWIILRAKGIPYDEQLISLQNKPEWYKALVPTTLVPAVLFHGETGEEGDDGEGEGDVGEGKKKKNERRIVWESADIIRALEEEFPNTPEMLRDTPEYDAAVKMNDDLTSAGFRFIYAGRNDTLSEEDESERRDAFLSELDRLDAALKVQQQQQQRLETTSASSDGGGMHFRLGADFTAADAIMIPTLERWRIQLPLAVDVDILEGRPALTKWFEAVDSYAPYSERVMGDEYSWTATNSVFLRIFGGGEDEPEVAAAIRRSDDAAARLTGDDDDDVGTRKKFSMEAASKFSGLCSPLSPIGWKGRRRERDSLRSLT